MVRRWMGVVCSMEGYTVHHWDEGEDYFQGDRDLTEWAYWVLILQIRCIFSAKLSKRFDCWSQILSKKSFPGERILWENYPKILTFSSVYYSPRKIYNTHANATLVKKNIYNPPYSTTHQLCFRHAFSAHGLIRAPLPSWILRTVGTLSYNYIRRVVHSSNW